MSRLAGDLIQLDSFADRKTSESCPAEHIRVQGSLVGDARGQRPLPAGELGRREASEGAVSKAPDKRVRMPPHLTRGDCKASVDYSMPLLMKR